jgi:hypothetical protein
MCATSMIPEDCSFVMNSGFFPAGITRDAARRSRRELEQGWYDAR